MYVCMYVCMEILGIMYQTLQLGLPVHVYMYGCMDVCMYVCMFVCLYVWRPLVYVPNPTTRTPYTWMYLWMYACMHVCMYDSFVVDSETQRSHFCVCMICFVTDLDEHGSAYVCLYVRESCHTSVIMHTRLHKFTYVHTSILTINHIRKPYTSTCIRTYIHTHIHTYV